MANDPSKDRNFNYFQSHLSGWLNDPAYKHKFVVIHDEKVKGVYDQFAQAIEFAAANFQPGQFIIQQVLAENEQINYLRSAV